MFCSFKRQLKHIFRYSIMFAVLLDLDDVLIHEGFSNPVVLCDETLKSLTHLQTLSDVQVVLMSNNSKGRQLLESAGVDSFFDSFFFGPEHEDLSKHLKLSLFLHTSNIDPSMCVLFDDLEVNLQTARSLNISTSLVDWTKGIQLSDLKRELFFLRIGGGINNIAVNEICIPAGAYTVDGIAIPGARKNRVICGICQVYINSPDDGKHCNGKKHKRYLKEFLNHH